MKRPFVSLPLPPVAFGRALALFLSIAVPAGAAVIEPARPAAPSVLASPLSEIRFSQPAQRDGLHEGEIVEIRWSGVPAEADEVELLLSVDGGRHFSLRLTDQLDSGSRSFFWRVPALAAESAALAIRAGIYGREITSDPGPRFRLSRNPSTAGIPLRWEGGEIWVDTSDRAEAAGRNSLLPSGLSARPQRITSVPDDSDAVDLPRFSNDRPSATVRETHRRALLDPDTPVLPGARSRAPLSIQQRI